MSGYSFPAAPIQVDFLHLRLNSSPTYISFSTLIKVFDQYGFIRKEYRVSGFIKRDRWHYVVYYHSDPSLQDLLWITLCQMLITEIDHFLEIPMVAIIIVMLAQRISEIYEERRPPKHAPPHHL